nr:gliding motility-associated C-terminal domain-containing protein [uncultured Carboxylicivirga sp.]
MEKNYTSLNKKILPVIAALLLTFGFINTAQSQSCVTYLHCDNGADVLLDCPDVPTWTEYFWEVTEKVGGTGNPGTVIPELTRVDGSDYYFTPSNVPAAYLNREILIVCVKGTPSNRQGQLWSAVRIIGAPDDSFTLTGDTEACLNSPFTLTLSGSQDFTISYKLYREGSGGVLLDWPGDNGPIDFTLSESTAGTYKYYVIAEGAACSSTIPADPANYPQVIVHSKPTITIGNDGPKCAGEDIQLSGGENGMITYSWSGPGGYSSSDQNPLLSNVSASDQGTYTLNITDGNGCENTATTDVTVWSLPEVTASNTGPICEDGSVTLQAAVTSGTAPYSFEWTKLPGSTVISTDQDYVIDPVTLSDAGTYEVSVTDANSCVASVADQTTLVVNDRPTVSLAYNNPVCEGLDLVLTATPAGGTTNYVTYTWYKNGSQIGTSAVNTFTIAATVAPDDDGEYSVTVVDDAGCLSDPALVDVTIHPRTQATADNDGPVCEGEDVQLTGGPGGMTSYSWTGPNGFTSGDQSPLLSTVTLAMAGDYTLTIVDGNTCTTSATTTVVVNERATINALNDSPVCEGEDVNLTSNVTGGTGPFTYSWTKLPSATEISNQAAFTLSNVTVADAGQYQLVVTDDNGCDAVAPSITNVVINPVATITADNDGPVCVDGTVAFSSTVTGGTGPFTYNWVYVPTGTTVSTLDAFTIDPATLADAGEYQLTVVDDKTCSPTPVSTILIVNQRPTVTISYNNPVCENEDLVLTATANGGSTVYTEYVWYKGGVEINRGASNTYTIAGVTPADDDIYSVTVQDDEGCISDIADVVVTVHPTPAVTAGNDSPVCAGENVQLTGGPGSMTTYAWTGPNGYTNGAQSPVLTSVTTAMAGTYTLTVTDGFTCTASASTDVIINDVNVGLSINPAPPGTKVCEYTNLNFVATASLGSGDYTYLFNVNGVDQANPTNSNNIVVSITQNTTVIVTVTDNVTGCSDSDSQTIEMVPAPSVSITSPVDGAEFCYGEPVTITALPYDADFTYEFFYNDGSGDVSLGAASNNNTITVTGGFTSDVSIYVITNNSFGCNSQSSDINLVINPLPVPTITGDLTPCENNAVTYTTESGMSNYVWTFTGGTIVSGGNGSDFIEINWTTPGSTTLSVTYTNTKGCDPSSATTANIEVGALPIITISGDSEVCLSETSIYTTELGMSSYVWTVNGGTIDSGQGSNSINVTWDTEGAGYVEVNYVNSVGCTLATPQRLVVNVNAIPTPTITGDFELCINEVKTYSTEAGKSNYQWVVTNGTIQGASDQATVDVLWDVETGPWSISVNYEESAASCSAASPTVETVTVNPLPVPTITGDLAPCENSTVIYTTESGMSNYVWTFSGGNIVSGGNGSDFIEINWTASGPTTLSVTYTNTKGCDPSSATIANIEVGALPSISITGNNETCLNTTTVYATESGMLSYVWAVSGGTIDSGQGTNSIEVTWDTPGGGYVEVNYVNTVGCTLATPYRIPVNVNNLPVPTITGDLELCLNEVKTYSTETGKSNYQWAVTNGSIQGATDQETVNVLWDVETGPWSISVNYEESAGNCSAASPTVENVTVNPLPVPTITGDLAPCENSVVTYTTEPGMSNYIWSYPDGQLVSGGNGNDFVEIRWPNSGSTTLTVNYTNTKGCNPLSATTVNIEVGEIPIISIIGQTEVCLDETITYSTESGMSGYVWSVNGGTINSGQSTNSIEVTWNTAGGGYVEVNYVNPVGCSLPTPERRVVTVYNRPTPTITGDLNVCLNDTKTYSTQTGRSNYVWIVTGGIIVGPADQESVDVLWDDAAGPWSISVNYEETAGSCAALVPTSEVVNVNPLPDPTITGPTDVCANTGGHIYSTDSGNGSYVWTIVGGPTVGTIDSGANSESVEVTWLTAGTQYIEVTYIDGNGCSPSAPKQYEVVVNALPVPTISGPATVCNGTTITYSTESGMSNYFWEVDAGGTIIGSNTNFEVTIQWTAINNQNIRVSYTDTNGCDAASASELTVNVTDLPNPTISGLDNVCEGHTITYTTESGAVNYDWQITGGTIVSDPTLSTVDVVWADPTAPTHEISVNYELFACPASSPFVLPVTVNPVPTVSLTGDNEACLNTTVTYTTESGQNNYVWNVTGGTITNSAPYSNEVTVLWDVVGTGTIDVNYQNGSGCYAVNPTQLEVQVHSLPIPTISGDAVVCNTYSSVYRTELGMSNYNWQLSGGGTIVSGDGTEEITVLWSTIGDYTLTVEYDDVNTCGVATPASMDITVQETPVPTIAGPVVTCNDNVSIYSTETGKQNYIWNVPVEGTIVSGDGTETISVLWNTTGTHTISVNYENLNGCAGLTATEMDVLVNPLSGVTLNATSTNVIVGTPIDFTANGTDVVNYVFKVNEVEDASHDGSATYTWTPTDVSDDNSIIRVIAETSTGCKDSAEIVISVFDGVIPTNVLPVEQTYCEGSPDALSIYVAPDILQGVTYELIRNEDNQLIASTNVTSPTTEVRWTHGVDGVDLSYVGVATYRVEAFWPAVPGDRVTMNGTAQITEVTLPVVQDMSPIGTVTDCNNYEITLLGSELGMEYELYIDGNPTGQTVPGDGNAITFGVQNAAGVYTIIGYNLLNSSCQVTMNGTFTIDVPGVAKFNLIAIGGSTNYCAGEDGIQLGLDGSEVNVIYQLKDNTGNTLDTQTGTGSELTFSGLYKAGTYSVIVEISGGCVFPMNNTVVIVEDALPVIYNVMAENDGHYCVDNPNGVEIYLDDQEDGVEYQLYRDNSPVGSPITGVTGSGILSFGSYTEEGVYTVSASNQATSCSEWMNGQVTVISDPLPTGFVVSTDGDYCTGGTTFIYLSGSETGVEYRWEREGDLATGAWITGTGSELSFEVSETDTYFIVARRNDGLTSCANEMLPRVTIAEKPYADLSKTLSIKTGTGLDCNNGAVIIVEDSEEGVIYELAKGGVRTGNTVVGIANQDVEFMAVVDKDATYQVYANLNGCEALLSNTIYIDVPGAIDLFEVTGDEEICNGDIGVRFGLSGSENGVTYTLYKADGTFVGVYNGLEFPYVNEEGEYYVLGDDGSGCTIEMLNRKSLVVNPLPIAYEVTGSGYYCDSNGASIGLSATEAGVNYQLQYTRGGSTINIGTLKSGQLDGSGITFDEFGPFTIANYPEADGVFTVVAINDVSLCTSSMNGSVVLSEKEALQPIDLSYSTSYCSDENGSLIETDISETEAIYSLIDVNTGEIVISVDGTGSSISFGYRKAGTYRVDAAWGEDGCAVEGLYPEFTISESYEPVDQVVTPDEVSACGQSEVTISIEQREPGVVYYLYELGDYPDGSMIDVLDDSKPNIIEFATLAINQDIEYEVIAAGQDVCEKLLGIVTVSYKDSPSPYSMFAIDDSGVTVTDTAKYCNEGVQIGLSSTENGIAYILYKEFNEEVGYVTGNGGSMSFTGYHLGVANDTIAYSVRAINNQSGCSTEWTDTIQVISLPVADKKEVSVVNNTVCGDNSTLIVLSDKQDGVSYYLDSNVQGVDGTTDITWEIPAPDIKGTYTYKIYGAINGGCETLMDSVQIEFKDGPLEFSMFAIDDSGVTVTDTAKYCSQGVQIGLSSTENGIAYILSNDLEGEVGYLTGDGNSMLFTGYHLGASNDTITYSVRAINNQSGCPIDWSHTIKVVELTGPEMKSVTISNNVVCGSSGAEVTLADSEVGVIYSLFDGTVKYDSKVGDGSDLVWIINPSLLGDYTYSIVAQSQTSCESIMDEFELEFKEGPSPFTVYATDGITEVNDEISYCADGNGIQIGVRNTQEDIAYILYQGDLDTRVGFISGNGNDQLFTGYFMGDPNSTVNYFVEAINFNTGCNVIGINNINVVENALPEPFNITLNGDVINDGEMGLGIIRVDEIGLNLSTVGVAYSLLRNDLPYTSVDPIQGDGNELNFGTQTESGIYTVQATELGCSNLMFGSVRLDATQLIAVDDTIAASNLVSDTINVWENDVKDEVYLDILGANIEFSLRYASEERKDTLEGLSLKTDFGNEVVINQLGHLTFKKNPVFYGRDSVQYIIKNTTIENRQDTAYVYFFIGNFDVDDDNMILIPNAFSPNGDGINDYYKIQGSFTDEVGSSSLEVYNRWGTLVYRSKGERYDNSWDGKSNAGAMVSLGENLPNGTYFYIFSITIIEEDANGNSNYKTKEYNGFIELRR